jgi:hypothetical protein
VIVLCITSVDKLQISDYGSGRYLVKLTFNGGIIVFHVFTRGEPYSHRRLAQP